MLRTCWSAQYSVFVLRFFLMGWHVVPHFYGVEQMETHLFSITCQFDMHLSSPHLTSLALASFTVPIYFVHARFLFCSLKWFTDTPDNIAYHNNKCLMFVQSIVDFYCYFVFSVTIGFKAIFNKNQLRSHVFKFSHTHLQNRQQRCATDGSFACSFFFVVVYISSNCPETSCTISSDWSRSWAAINYARRIGFIFEESEINSLSILTSMWLNHYCVCLANVLTVT